MSDVVLVELVKEWTKTLTYETSFSTITKIANHLQLPKPNDEKTYRDVLNYVATNYPSAYVEATKSCRDFWNID